MKHETAGDPQSALKWTRRTMDKIAAQLRALGLEVGSSTVGRLLRNMGFSLRVNHKKVPRQNSFGSHLHLSGMAA